MKVLITGISGFAGSHLAEYLLEKDIEVMGTIRWRSPRENIKHLLSKVNLYDCDLKDLSAVDALIEETKPDMIFHLAAQSFVPSSWRFPAETINNNIISELNIFEAVRKARLKTRIQIAGSSEEYGFVKESEVPVKESQPLRPLSPYAVSKVAQDMLGYQYFKSYGLNIIRTRAFNHTGPRRGEVFVVSNFAKQIVEIEKGLKPPVIKVGNLSAIRDFTDVRDTVKAYYSILLKGNPGDVYNIATGKGHNISEVLDMLLSLTDTDITVERDPQRLRPSDVEILIGDASKMKKLTDWRAEIPFKKTLLDTLDYWRERI